MATDFNINLAKSMASSKDNRVRFYNRMLIYFAVCSAAMVYVASASSVRFVKAIKANKQRERLIAADSSVSAYGKTFYENPAGICKELEDYARDLQTLQGVIAQRAQFLPVMNQLFKDFPKNVTLQDLTAADSDKTIRFSLVAPVFDQAGNDPIRLLQSQWKSNEELQQRVAGIRQVTSERRVVGDTAMAFVKIECVVK